MSVISRRRCPRWCGPLRYGDVRGTDTAALGEVAVGLAERVFVGLPPACAGLDADAALEMRGHVDAVHQAVGLLGDLTPPNRCLTGAVPAEPSGARGLPGARARGARWDSVLRVLGERDSVAGVVRGRCVRLLMDGGELGEGEAAGSWGSPSPGDRARRSRRLDRGVRRAAARGRHAAGARRAAARAGRRLADGVPDAAFTDVLPLLRRTFSAYEPGVRRTLGELVRRGPAPYRGLGQRRRGGARLRAGLDAERADAVLPILRLLLGLPGAGERAYAATPHGGAPHGAAPLGTGPRPERHGSELTEVTGTATTRRGGRPT